MKYSRSILKPSQQQEVRTLIQKLWVPESRKTTVCIDSYLDGVFRGRFYDSPGEEHSFSSLGQFLVMMEDRLEQKGEPQSDTVRRRFCTFLQPEAGSVSHGGIRRGKQATFVLQILFRQHSSWQGTVCWQEQRREESFRSVLELILLMDSALRETEEREAV